MIHVTVSHVYRCLDAMEMETITMAALFALITTPVAECYIKRAEAAVVMSIEHRGPRL